MLNRNLFVKNFADVSAKLKRKIGENSEVNSSISELSVLIRARREIQSKLEKLKSERNISSKEFGKNLISLSEKDKIEKLTYLTELKNKIQDLENSLTPLKVQEDELLLQIPNIPSDSTPDGSGDWDNPVIRYWGKEFATKKPLTHDQIGETSGGLSVEDGVKLSGTRFIVMKDRVAKLDRRLTNFFMDWHTRNGYEEVSVPYIVTRKTMTGTGQLPKFEDDLFKLTTKINGEDAFLIPTGEVPVTNLYRDILLYEESLPIRHVTFSPCFRAEAGSAGRDIKGLIRLHQFNKVELVSFCNPKDSLAELEKITNDAESVLQALSLPYRVIERCTADLGFGGYKGYDIEVWMAGQGAYREISSATLFGDFQARRASLKYESSNGNSEFVHTLNASGVAVGRCLAAIMEFYQKDDGSFSFPEVLE